MARITAKQIIKASPASNPTFVSRAIEQISIAAAYQEIDPEKHPLFLKTIGPELAADMIVDLPDTLNLAGDAEDGLHEVGRPHATLEGHDPVVGFHLHLHFGL